MIVNTQLLHAYYRRLLHDRVAGNALFILLMGFLPLSFGSIGTFWYYYGAAVLVFFAVKGRASDFFTLPPPTVFAVVSALFVFIADLAPRILLPNGERGLIYLLNSLQFLIFPLLLLGLWRTKEVDYFLFFIKGLRYAPFVALPVAVVQTVLAVERPSGALGNALPFGDIALICSMFALLLVDWRNRREALLAVAALFAGFTCIVLAQARGPLLVSPLLLLLVGVHLMQKRLLRWQHMAAVVAGLLVVLALAVSFGGLGARLRYVAGASEMLQGQVQSKAVSESETERLTMWHYGLKAAREHYLWGLGPQNRPQFVRDMAKADGRGFPAHTHLHNEYLTTLVDKGLAGLLALLMLLAAPVVVALLPPRDARYGARLVAALVLSLGYGAFGLTNLAFGHDILNTFYAASLLMICLSAAQSKAGIAFSEDTVQRFPC